MLAGLSMISQVAVSSSISTTSRPKSEPLSTSLVANPSVVVTLSAEAVQRSSLDSVAVRYGYSAGGTYFGSPDEFFALQKTHYQQLGYDVSDEWVAYFKNEITHPNPDGGVISAAPLRGSANIIEFADVLTDMDKAIIQQVSPFSEGGSGPRQINGLAVVIALERFQGNLQGEIDADYAINFKSRMLTAKSTVLPLNTLDRLIAVVSADHKAGWRV